jgi:hypothetical protein
MLARCSILLLDQILAKNFWQQCSRFLDRGSGPASGVVQSLKHGIDEQDARHWRRLRKEATMPQYTHDPAMLAAAQRMLASANTLKILKAQAGKQYSAQVATEGKSVPRSA